LPPLARDHRVLAPDLRGWGWSDAPEGDYAKATLAEDIVGLLDVEGIERVRIIGHDWGAYTALLMALTCPKRVERVVALDIAPPGPPAFGCATWRLRFSGPIRHYSQRQESDH
jgi:pimeloyl-ACP methyl ester carboxylesterase